MELLCITGMDGVGKTTLAEAMVRALNSSGKSAVYRYGRVVPVLSRLLMQMGCKVYLRSFDPFVNYEGYIHKKKQVMSSSLFRFCYCTAVYLDYFPQIWLKLLPLYFSSKVVILDRFFQDTLINEIAVQLGYSLQEFSQVLNKGLRMLPTVRLMILIDVPEELAFSRKSDIPHISYLRQRRRYYAHLRDYSGYLFVSGETDPDNVLQYVLSAYTSQQTVKLDDETVNLGN